MIYKLDTIVIRGQLLSWFENHLSERRQAVVVKGSISEFVTISTGVPKGSAIGALLFLIYINNIPIDIESTLKLFADDTSMYLSRNDNRIRG